MIFPKFDIKKTLVPDGSNVQPGFDAWNVGSDSAASFSTTFDQSGFNLPSGTITVRGLDGAPVTPVAETLPHDLIHPDIADLMREEGVIAQGGLEIQIHDLVHDGLMLKSYHYHNLGEEADPVIVDVTMSKDGINFTPLGSYVQGSMFDPPTEVYSLIDTYAGNDMYYRFHGRRPDGLCRVERIEGRA